MIEAYREFIREQSARFDRALREVAAEIRAQREDTRAFRAETRALRQEFRALREENRRYHDREDKRTDDLIQENRAQRMALLQILDRLSNGGTAAAG